MALNVCSPAAVAAVCGPRAGAESMTMKLVSAAVALPLSLRPGAGLNASSAQFPCGQFSSGKSGVVIPISLTSASPANWTSVGTCAFHPKRPAVFIPARMLSTVLTLPTTPSPRAASAAASEMNVASGVASTRPRPKSGVVRRCTTIDACAGMVSGAKACVEPLRGPIARLCCSDPPSSASAS